MHSLIGKIIARNGERDAVASNLIEGVAGMPGCLSYVVAADEGDPHALWVTEVWDREESHALAARFVTRPLGGQGL
jgi:quinol monooxygenase YgiN